MELIFVDLGEHVQIIFCPLESQLILPKMDRPKLRERGIAAVAPSLCQYTRFYSFFEAAKRVSQEPKEEAN